MALHAMFAPPRVSSPGQKNILPIQKYVYDKFQFAALMCLSHFDSQSLLHSTKHISDEGSEMGKYIMTYLQSHQGISPRNLGQASAST